MSDTNFSYMEVSAKRKKRNQFISVLIIVAIVLLGVIVWGWIELQKSRNAERIKNALNSQVEPGFKEPETTAMEPAPAPAPDTGSVTVQDAPKAPEPVAAPETPKAPEPAKVRKEPAKTAKVPKEPEYREPKPAKTHVAKAPPSEPVKPTPAKEPEQVAMVTEPKPKTETAPAKAF